MAVIKVGDQTAEITERPITLVIPSAGMSLAPPIEYPGRASLDPEVTLHHARLVRKLHPNFDTAWRLFHSQTSPPSEVGPADPEEIRGMGQAAVHLMGLIDLTLKLFDRKARVVWVKPETYMHPGWQVALGDLAIWFADLEAK